jgi:hypothetical protein
MSSLHSRTNTITVKMIMLKGLKITEIALEVVDEIC